MKHFSFRLEGVLRLRRLQEQQAKDSLLGANSVLRQQILARDAQSRRYHEVVDGAAASALEEFRAEQLAAQLCAATLAGAEQAVAYAASDAALAQIAYHQAAQIVAVIERLEDRRRAEHVAAEGRELVALTDDIVTARYVRDHFNPGGDAA